MQLGNNQANKDGTATVGETGWRNLLDDGDFCCYCGRRPGSFTRNLPIKKKQISRLMPYLIKFVLREGNRCKLEKHLSFHALNYVRASI